MPPPEAAPGRIALICAPNELLGRRASRLAASRGYQPVAAPTMAEAVRVARGTRPAVCLLQSPFSPEDAREFDRLSHDPLLHDLAVILLLESALEKPDFDDRLADYLPPLPVGDAPAGRAVLERLGELPGTDVIVVEDSVDELELLLHRLLRAGHRACAATSGREALWLIRHLRPRLMILDVSLPDGDGFELVTRLRRDPQFTRLPVLVYSGLTLQPAHRALLQLGPTRFLSKAQAPPEKLMAEVRAMLASPSA